MKKIEKTFWVSDYFVKVIGNKEESKTFILREFPSDSNKIKIKISFEVPEKKIEITESEFDEVAKDNFGVFLKCNDTHRLVVDNLKQKLFGKTE